MTEFNLDRVAGELNSRGIAAEVDHSGGGVATLYAGKRFFDRDGEPRWQIIAGPGWFEQPGYGTARADTGDFAVGPDDDGTDDVLYGTSLTAPTAAGVVPGPRAIEDAITDQIIKQLQDFTWTDGAYQRADGHWGEHDVLADERQRARQRVRTARRDGHVMSRTGQDDQPGDPRS